jgi:hypothetical protein
VSRQGGVLESRGTDNSLAIDYIRSTQHAERSMSADLQRLQRECDYGREREKENDMLRTELSVMHQAMRRLDPSAPHIFGHFTQQLSQSSGPQVNGASGISLPPLVSGQGPPASYNGGPPPVAAMQGVEYGGYGGR